MLISAQFLALKALINGCYFSYTRLHSRYVGYVRSVVLECDALVFGKSLKQLNKAIIDQARLSLAAFGLLKSLWGFLVKSARYTLIFAPNCRGGLGVGFRFLSERNLVNAVAILVDADRVL